MAELLRKKDINPDLILSSSAVRAFEFAKIIADELDYKKKNITATNNLYMADEMDMLEIVRSVDDINKTVFLVGHNPDLTYFANSLCNYNIDNIPTSGIFGIEFDIDSWKDIDFGKGKFNHLNIPESITISFKSLNYFF